MHPASAVAWPVEVAVPHDARLAGRTTTRSGTAFLILEHSPVLTCHASYPMTRARRACASRCGNASARAPPRKSRLAWGSLGELPSGSTEIALAATRRLYEVYLELNLLTLES